MNCIRISSLINCNCGGTAVADVYRGGMLPTDGILRYCSKSDGRLDGYLRFGRGNGCELS